eukprot:15472116-Alexandrium_andersonii.AAC.1
MAPNRAGAIGSLLWSERWANVHPNLNGPWPCFALRRFISQATFCRFGPEVSQAFAFVPHVR